MEYQVKKRDGAVVSFDKEKIINAVLLAFEDIDGSITTYAKNKSTQIAGHIETIIKQKAEHDEVLSVEEIQNIIEDKLCASQRKDVAASFIRYRYKKEVARNFQTDFIDAIREKLNADNVQNQNANVDEHSFGGRIGEASGVVTKKLALDYVVSEMARNNHLNNEVYIHDLDSYYIGNHNCLSIPFDDLLAKGFNTRQTDVRPANSINTAFQLLAVIFQLQSLQQFGGVSATHLDWTMVPYVRKSFYKHFVDGLNYFVDPLLAKMHLKELDNSMSIDDRLYKLPYSQVYKYAMEMTQRELDQAVEGMFHNLNTLQSRSGNQLPFTSINFGTCTLPEGRMVIKSLLEGSIKGVGKFHKTSIFPCSIFQYMRGVNDKPGTLNYDLYRLALESTSKRLYPNYANVDWSGNIGYDRNDPKTYFSTMGCLDYNEKIIIRSGKDSYEHNEAEVKIGDLFEHIQNGKSCSYKDQKLQTRAKYIDNEEDRRKFIDNGYLVYSGDHFNQWAINFKNTYGRKPTKSDFKDVTGVYWDRHSVMTRRGADMSLVSKWDSYLELKVCDILTVNGFSQKFTIEDCKLDTDYIRNKVFTCLDGSRKQGDIYFPKLNLVFEINDFMTHSKDSDEELYLTESGILAHIDDYQGYKKGPSYSKKKISSLKDLGITTVEIWEDSIRDGSFIEILSTNLNMTLTNNIKPKELCSEIKTPRTICIDLEKLGVNKFVKDIDGSFVKIKKILRNSDVTNWMKITTVLHTILVTTDHPFINESGQIIADELSVNDYLLNENNEREVIINIEYFNDNNYSYDIETESETFVFSGIQSHNCRTANGADINAEPGVNPQTKDGRGNICPVTIIMPTLAMEAREQVKKEFASSYIPQSKDWYDKKVIEKFFFILGKKIEEARDMLIERYEWICSQSPASAKFMYENHTMLGYKPEEGIRSALKHGTLVIGQLGLAETLQLLIGCDHTTEEGMKLAKQIEQLFKDRCADYKQLYKLNFGVYYSPAENLCYTAMKKFRDKYGIIPKVSDKEYFTNSMHVPVYHNLSVFDKIDIESQLTGYSSAGCITYVELDSTAQNNIDALEEIVNYAMEKDIPYFAINVPNDTCLECGFTGEFNDECPKCGSKHIQQLRRVTGYLTGSYKDAFNWGKQKETEDRVKHANIME